MSQFMNLIRLFLKRVPLFLPAVIFIAGIAAGEAFRVSFLWWFGAAVILITAGIGARDHALAAYLCAVLCVFACGGLILSARQYRPGHDVGVALRGYSREALAFRGDVASVPRKKRAINGTRTIFHLRVLEVKKGAVFEALSGTVLVKLYGDVDVRVNDRVALEGVLTQPFDFGRDRKFSYRRYLRRQGINWVVNVNRSRPFVILERKPNSGRPAGLRAVSALARARLERYFCPEESGLLSTILLGDRTGLPAALSKIFTRTGTAHMLPTDTRKKYCPALPAYFTC